MMDDANCLCSLNSSDGEPTCGSDERTSWLAACAVDGNIDLRQRRNTNITVIVARNECLLSQLIYMYLLFPQRCSEIVSSLDRCHVMSAPKAIEKPVHVRHSAPEAVDSSRDDGRKRVVVIGAGISGLSAAYALLKTAQIEKQPLDVVILESTARAGGVINTVRDQARVIECGPEAFITVKPHAVQLCEELGIANRLISTASEHRRTFVAFEKQLHPLPDGFMMLAPTQFLPFVTSKLFSVGGKMRMALDLILPKAHWSCDESLSSFVSRRLGQEALERIAEPMIGGIYGGNPEQLSARATVAKLVDIEEKYGSLIRGLWQEKRSNQSKMKKTPGEQAQAGPRYSQMASLDYGMSVLIDSLVCFLPDGCLLANRPVEKIREGVSGRRWDIFCSDKSVLSADAVILAIPAKHAAGIVSEVSATLSDRLSVISYATTTVVNLIYKRKDIPHLLNGFGFVVPKTEGRHVRACTFSSIKFANRTPDSETLLRAFVANSDANDSELEQLVFRDLNYFLGVNAEPVSSIVYRHATGIPQYAVGHGEIVRDIELAVSRIPRLALAGNAYGGVGIPDCIESGKQSARAVLSQLFQQ
ncbi:protoporphyrinogen oxidase [soil metagenome]